MQPGRGVKVRSIYYWCDEFRAPEIERKGLPVRYDPFDAGTAYAFVGNRWVACHSEYYSALRGRSEKEMMLATQELHKQNSGPPQRLAVNAEKLAALLQSVEAKKALLVQRARDREVCEALTGASTKYEDSSSSVLARECGAETSARDASSRSTRLPDLREEYGVF